MSALLRSALFVPGSRPERFSKALATGADVVIVDFEDAVEAQLKPQARENLRVFLEGNTEVRVWVRVNMSGHAEHAADLELCRHAGVCGVMLPKAESAEQVSDVAALGKPVIPIVESARGMAELAHIARVAGVERLTFGGLDLSLDLGLVAGTPAAERLLDQVRFSLLVHSRLASLAAPLDTVFPNIEDLAGLARCARDSGDMGFSGMLCIHPKQVAEVHAALAPGVSELDWARRVLAAADGSGAYQLDGQMVDAPVIARAQRLLASAG